jgi:hypothetical protein
MGVQRHQHIHNAATYYVAVLICTALLGMVTPTFAAATTGDVSCHELGFADSLLCSRCDAMKEFIDDDTLLSECQSCCADDSSIHDSDKYTSAVLRVCN